MSDNIGEYDGTKEVRRDVDGERVNRWQGKQAKTARGNRKRQNNKEGERYEGRQRRREERENWKRGRVVRDQAKRKGRQRN